MRLAVILVAAAAIGLFLGSAHAQEQPHVTTIVTGPAVASPGSQATYNIDVTLSGETSADIYIDWTTPTATSAAADICCDYVSSTVRSGDATVVGQAAGDSMRWSINAPAAQIQLVLGIRDNIDTATVTVSTYLPGTDVAQYETVTPAVSQIVRLPQTGGPPSAGVEIARDAITAGAALLLASAACVVCALRRLHTGEMP